MMSLCHWRAAVCWGVLMRWLRPHRKGVRAMNSLYTETKNGKTVPFSSLLALDPCQWVGKTLHTSTVTNCFEIVGKRRGWVVQRIKGEHIVLRVWTLFPVLPLFFYKYFESSRWVLLVPFGSEPSFMNIWKANEWNEGFVLLLWIIFCSTLHGLAHTGGWQVPDPCSRQAEVPSSLSVAGWGPYTDSRSGQLWLMATFLCLHGQSEFLQNTPSFLFLIFPGRLFSSTIKGSFW